MAQRGPKPKPNFLRVMEGNPGHRPINQDEPIVDGNIADPPAFLSARQQHYWRDTVAHAPLGMLKQLDEGTLMIYVIALADLEFATVQVEKVGPVVEMPGGKGNNGYVMQNPYVAMKRNAMEKVLKAGAELGFTPSSRSRVKVVTKKKGKSAFGKLREFKV